MSEQYEPEVGQMLFGNPTSEYEVSDFVEALIAYIFGEVERVYWNTQQKQWDRGEELTLWPFLEYRPYYWGECACGYEERFEAARKYDAFEDELMDELCAQYGLDRKFGAAVHCTCDYERKRAEWVATDGHAPDCPLILPNFKFAEVSVSWYKHFGRGMSLNVKKSEAEWREWFNRCLKAIREQDVEH